MSTAQSETPRTVDQTEFGELGNCQSACFATLLGLPILEVPNWSAMEGSDQLKFDAMHCWLRARGWGLITVARGEMPDWPPRHGYFIAGGKSSRGLDHAVIYRDGELWHDPHPDRTGIESVETLDILYPLCPRESASQRERIATLTDALQELLDAGDNSVNPKDGDDCAAMLRFGKATDAARSALRAGEGEKL